MITKEELKKKLKWLLDDYLSYSEDERKNMNEDQTRAKFIDPLLKDVLGWRERQMDRQTSIEALSPHGHMKRADYSYPKIPKVIVEAKKLKVPLDDGDFDQQVIDYAYSKAVNWAVLTNFKSFRVWYVTRDANPMYVRLNIVEDDLDKTVDELLFFTDQCLLNGELDKKAEQRGIRLKEIDISADLTESLNNLRTKINNYVKKEYGSKYGDEVVREELTQGIINRLIFIKKVEAEGLEENKLEQVIRSQRDNIYDSVKSIFGDYRNKYDSDIFGTPGEKSDAEKLELADNFTRELLEVVSGPEKTRKTYNFAAMDVDVLGAIYENYLEYIQKGIKLTGGRKRRKIQGIYYTPRYVVDYIVQTIFNYELAKGATQKELQKLKILDMACGSGSFFIGAANELDKYYASAIKDYDNYSPKEKLDLIKHNLFGVDLDDRAVAIAKLNMYLKLLVLAKKQRSIGTHETMLPALANMKIGNSLIDNTVIAGLTEEDRGFKWEERFPDVIQYNDAGELKPGYGFDIIIGNPPYVENKKINKKEKEYLTEHYESAYKLFDYSVPFIEKSIKLLKTGGYFGFIITNKFTITDYGRKIREMLLDKVELKQIIDLSTLLVFKRTSAYPIILIFKKRKPDKTNVVNLIVSVESEEDFVNKEYKTATVKQTELKKIPESLLPVSENLPLCMKILNKADMTLGEVVGKNMDYRPLGFTDWRRHLDHLKDAHQSDSLKFIGVGNLDKYAIYWDKELGSSRNRYVKKYLPKPHDISDEIWENLKTPKILIREVSKNLIAAYDEKGEYVHITGMYSISNVNNGFKLKYLLGLINSRLLDFYYSSLYGSSHMAGGYLNYHGSYLKQLPIAKGTGANQSAIVDKVNALINVNNELVNLGDRTTNRAERLKEERTRLSKEIDEIVYKIYDITDDEKRLINA